LEKRFSESCVRNTAPILQVLESVLGHRRRILEIGSGTGQHSVAFTQQLPQLVWQATDRPGFLDSVRAWHEEAAIPSILPSLELDLLDKASWPVHRYDLIFAVNVIHIAPWAATAALFELASQALESDGLVFLYGPFRFPDRPMEASNEAFDLHLRNGNSESGIRHFDKIEACARDQGFVLAGQQSMPANNHCLWWGRSDSVNV